jgi:hypothetical protein
MLSKFLLLNKSSYIYDMEQAAILKKELRSKVSGVVVPKDSVVIYCDNMRAVKVGSKSNKSDLWLGVRERDIEIIGWKTIK